ncbi:MAG: hypothetical protein M3Y65_03620 [Pseudomonadota bacterium]|nr:hypothetical protein [Pseudomonadota bacterium]
MLPAVSARSELAVRQCRGRVACLVSGLHGGAALFQCHQNLFSLKQCGVHGRCLAGVVALAGLASGRHQTLRNRFFSLKIALGIFSLFT